MVDRYEASVDVLVALHEQQLPGTLPVAGGTDYAMPTFDVAAMLIEVGLLLDWYLPDRGLSVAEPMRTEFEALWRDLPGTKDDLAAVRAKCETMRDFIVV